MNDSRFFDSELLKRAEGLLQLCRASNLRLVVAESCTGGLVAALLTEIPGSSAVMDRGFVTYSNDAKIEALGVSEKLLHDHGAVSDAVARAMAEGAVNKSHADIGVAITGVAGPDGGTFEKPIGLVHFAVAARTRPTSAAEHRFGPLSRSEIRRAAVIVALDMMERAAMSQM